jgi:hypothetical protein
MKTVLEVSLFATESVIWSTFHRTFRPQAATLSEVTGVSSQHLFLFPFTGISKVMQILDLKGHVKPYLTEICINLTET